MAMDHRSVYGVSFNIQNAPGSSGAVLNNRSGGHWYRVLGPHDPGSSGWSGAGSYNVPLSFDRSVQGYNNPAGDTELGGWLAAVQRDFIGEKITLPKGQVRFLALMDEDNGNNWTPYSKFGPTYPRPWFGVFTKGPGDAQPRYYAWGGYDPGFSDFWQGIYWRPVRPASVNYSGFYYQGNDGPIVGCTNPADRKIIDDPAGTSATAQKNFTLLAKGEGRPLVNGDWLDCVIYFNPDGTATMGDWMRMRHEYGQTGNDNPVTAPWSSYWNDTVNHNLTDLGPGDMCNYINVWDYAYAGIPYNNRSEASSYADVTGTYWFTLGSDAKDDTVKFASAKAALTAMLPAYRVGVTRLGEVKVMNVGSHLRAGQTFNTKWQGDTVWSANYCIGLSGYWNNLALNAAGQRLNPVEDAVTPEMMANRQWWLEP
jgi:hypothetical protein